MASPIVMIELVAQTGGISVGIEAMNKSADKKGGKGWIVGVRSARFHARGIPLGARLVCRATRSYEQDFYSLLDGTVLHDGAVIGEVSLQVLRSESSIPEGSEHR
jgi:predicted hotdog family 3-hydroxylacyl-ACP dehydratase